MNTVRITRREMMRQSAGVLTGLVLAGNSVIGAEEGQKKMPGFKIGACDWTLGKQCNVASFEVAKRIGIDGVQVSVGRNPKEMRLFKPDVQKQFLEEAAKNNVEITSLALGVLNDVPYKSKVQAEQWVSDSIDVCRAMGTKVILVAFFGKGDLLDDKKGTDVVIERLKRVTPKAEKAGVILGIESMLSAEQLMDIIDRVGSPAVGVYYDVANAQSRGYDIGKEIRSLGRHICEFHAKDNDNLYGQGSMDFKVVRRAMDDIGYRGWIVLEGSKMPLGVEKSCQYDAEYLRSIFPPKV